MATPVSQIQTRPPGPLEESSEDKSLVLLFQAGTPEAYDAIFERYRPLAERICYRILGDREDAQEAVQETMLRVLRGLPVFNGQYQLQAWITRIATNVSVDMVRARARRPVIDQSPVEEHHDRDPEPGPEVEYERLVQRDLVISVLSELPETHRTALVLRELEGRSHKEIASALDLSPAQAKALIHRAKGSFRLGWLRAVTERGGVAGIAVIPLILAMRVFEGARRVVDKVGGHAGQVAQVAQVATPEVVSSTAASPAVTAVAGVSERVVAAGMAVLLAGGVTVGAAKLAERNKDPETTRVEAVAAPVVAPEIVPVAPIVTPVKHDRPAHPKPEHQGVPAGEVDPEPTVPDGTDTGEMPSPVPSPGPDPSPSPGPSTPPIGPAPAWGLTFAAGISGPAPCLDCPGPTLVSSNVTGTAGQDVSISQVAQGTAMDVGGHPTWNLFLEYWGSASGITGQLQYGFKLGGQQGWYSYAGVATLTSSGPTDDGGYVYTFSGGYQLTDGAGSPGMPLHGSLQVTLRFWADGSSLYSTDVALYEV